MNEFDVIEKYFRPLTRGRKEALGLQDDGAVFDIPAGQQLVVTSDTLSAGTHFLSNEEPGFIAHKALRVNLSDLAAMGAKPLAYQLCVSFPGKPSEKWVKEFCGALMRDQKEFGIFCSGGDSTVIKGPLTISITAFGLVPKNAAVKRSGAKPGDALVITGPLGFAYAGLRMLQKKIKIKDKACIAAYRKPIPRLAAIDPIRRYANAAIDISDGLLADAQHICKASGCGARIEGSRVKFPKHIEISEALTGGDDYELALAVPPKHIDSLMASLAAKGLKPRVIGDFVKGKPVVKVFDGDWEIRTGKQGWTHF